MKRLLTFALSMLMVSALWAVPAKRGVQTITQPDGTTLRIELHGDEFFHFTTTEDGYLVKQNAAGVYEYAEVTAEKIVKTLGIKARSVDERTAADVKNLQQAVKAKNAFTGNERKVAKMQRQVKKSPAKVGEINLAPRGLVLLVQFADVKFDANSTCESMSEMLNGESYNLDGATGSARNYFIDQSNGKYTPQFDVYGPITVSENSEYYGTNYIVGGEPIGDLYFGQLVNEACSIANSNFGVDFSKYDANTDGEADIVYVIYAGYGENVTGTPNTYIWPHAFDLYSLGYWSNDSYLKNPSNRTYDDKIVNNYACSAELNGKSGTTRDGIGTFCHEFSHVLGLPDYYDIDYGEVYKDNATPGTWTLMDQGSYNNGGKTPPNYSAYDKFYLDWVTPSIMNEFENVVLGVDSKGRVVRSNGEQPITARLEGETVYYFENRQQSGWDAYLPGHGMLVWKVEYDADIWEANGPNDNYPMCYDIVEADGRSTGGDGGDTYPGSLNKTSYTPISGYPLTDIAEKDGVISFKFMGGVDCDGYTVEFDGENCIETNGKTCIAIGETYTSTITPAEGYKLTADDIIVGMGDDLAEFTYKSGVLTIPNVMGNVYIYAYATESSVSSAIETSELGTIFAISESQGFRLMNLPTNAQVRVFDTLGRLMLAETCTLSEQFIGISRGVYVVSIEAEGKQTILKVIK